MSSSEDQTTQATAAMIPGLSMSGSEDSHENDANLHDSNKENEFSDSPDLQYGGDHPIKPGQDTTTTTTTSSGCTKRRTLMYTSVFTAIAVLAMTVGISLSSTKSKRSNMSSVDQAALGMCPEGIIDRHWPMLQLKFDTTPMKRDGDKEEHTTMSEEDIVKFVKAVQDGYNTVTEQCGKADPEPFNRWSFTTSFVSQTLEGGLEMVQPEATTRNGVTYTMEHDFVDSTNLVVQIMLGISCDGCTADEAFATAYPTAFVPGYAAGGVFDGNDDGRRRLSVVNHSRILQEGEGVNDEDETLMLSAADLLTSISNAVQVAVPSLGPIAEATVTVMEQIDAQQMSGESDPITSNSLIKADVSSLVYNVLDYTLTFSYRRK